MAFETNMKEFRELTQQLEQGNLELEKAVELYSRGLELAATCRKELDAAKLTVEMRTVSLEQAGGVEDGE